MRLTEAVAGRLEGWLDRLGEKVLRWDEAALEWVSTNSKLGKLEGLWLLATFLGDGYLWGLVALYLVVVGGPHEHRVVLTSLGVMMVAVTLFRLFKMLFCRPRPLELGQLPAGWVLDEQSFPSGHATAGFTAAYLISRFFPGWPVGLVAYTMAAIIGLSRVYLREHYPSDVVGGALLGTLVAHLMVPVFWQLVHYPIT
jgi:undecaprenyl-diphosphatase